MSSYLKQLKKEGLITRREGKSGRIEYQLTEQGHSAEAVRNRSISAMYDAFRRVIGNYPLAKGILETAELARKDPLLVEALLQFDQQLMFLFDSDYWSRWSARHPDKDEESRVLKQELNKRLPSGLAPTETRAFIKWLQLFLDALYDIVTTETQGVR